jgi:hypothetical protein
MLNTQRRIAAASDNAFTVEALESRQLLTVSGPWVPYATLIGQDQAVAAYPYLTGAGETVALVDRGVDYNLAQLGGGVGPGFKVVGGYNFRDNNTTLLDDYGHGTGVAGIIAANAFTLNGNYDQGVASGTQLVMLKQESSANIKSALDWIIQNHSQYNIQVVNLTDFITDVLPSAWDPSVYASELQTLHNLNIFVCTPVGNGELYSLAHYGTSAAITDPALSPYVMGAGGVTQSDTLWNDSRRGAGLDILGPSENVTMTYYLQVKDSQGHGVGGYDQYDDNYQGQGVLVDYAKGTSWASAYVSGTAALLKQINPSFTPDQISQILTSTGTLVQDPENPGTYYPRLNVYAALTKGFQMIDDAHFGNDSFATAEQLAFTKGKDALTNLRLTMGHADYWSFTTATKGTVSVNLKYTASKTLPTLQIYDSNFNLVTQAKKLSISKKLATGTYYVVASSGLTTLPGTYNLTVSGGKKMFVAAGTPAAVTPANAAPLAAAMVNPFSTTAVGGDASTATSDLVLDKTATPVFA